MKRDSHDYKRFTALVLTVFTGLALAVVSFNFLIDPFGIHEPLTLTKFNEFKTSVHKHERLYKSVQVAKKKPQAILLGSSRVNVGINPDDVTALTGYEAYNAAFSGAEFEELYHYFEHALYHQPDLKFVILGLDFLAFSKKQRPQPDFSLDRLKTSPISWRDFRNSLFSAQALSRSYQTLKDNFFSQGYLPYLPNGQANPAFAGDKNNNPIIVKGDLKYLNMTIKVDFKDYEIDPRKIEMFRKIVQTCQERSIDLKCFFCPCKAIYWEAIYGKGLWPQFEELKRQLASIYPVWDFTGFNCVTAETLEEKGSPLYFECSHFTPYIGKIILDKLFDRSTYPSAFGYYLTPDYIEDALDEARQAAQKWAQTHHVMKELEPMPITAW